MHVKERKNRAKDNVSSSMENGEYPQIIPRSNIKGDEKNILLLFFLYTLQGIPLGLSAAIPMILQNRGVSYKQQAEFSFVSWPFSLKLLWAPLVDAIFSTRIGRRKTWLIPTQYLIGAFMLLLSGHVNQWLGDEGSGPNIEILTLLFFSLNFLAATQDIAVDGWALTMLKKQNVGHASTCNSVGQTTGYFLSYVLFMALESPTFCNQYLRTVPDKEGIVTLPGFLYFWGWVFLITTTLVAVMKKEVEPHDPDHMEVPDRDIKTAYISLKEILKLRSVQTLVLILLTCKIGFSSTDSVMTLKLVESGIPKERLGLIAVPLIPVQLAMPLVIAKYTTVKILANMSTALQNDIFQILETDHSFYLEEYYKPKSFTSYSSVELSNLLDELPCEYLIDNINSICDNYIKDQHDPVEDTKQQEAARIIQNFLLGARNRHIFKQIKESLRSISKKNPVSLLKSVSYPHAEIFEKFGSQLKFRLAGEHFPPDIVFKLFIGRHLTNIRLYEDIINDNRRGKTNDGWFTFKVYKCSVCKTRVKYKPIMKKKKIMKKERDNCISWIEEMYRG